MNEEKIKIMKKNTRKPQVQVAFSHFPKIIGMSSDIYIFPIFLATRISSDIFGEKGRWNLNL